MQAPQSVVYAVLVREKNGEPETYQDSGRISVR